MMHLPFFLLTSSTTSFATTTLSNKPLPFKNATCLLSITLCKSCNNLLDRIFDIILYTNPTKDIGLHSSNPSSNPCGCCTLGIKVTKDALHPFGHLPQLWKKLAAFIMSTLMVSQNYVTKLKLKPSGLGLLLFLQSQTATLISSYENLFISRTLSSLLIDEKSILSILTFISPFFVNLFL